MRVTCPSCDRPFRERSFIPGAARRCPHCEEIIFLPMEQVPEAYLVPLDGESTGTRIALAARMVIGRAHECEIRVLDATLSRLHAEICLDNGKFVITDLDSRNRVQINGVTSAEQELVHGDVIRLGNAIFRFEMMGNAAKPAAWMPEARTKLGDESESPSSSTVRMTPQESASLLAALQASLKMRGTAALAPVSHAEGLQNPATVPLPAEPAPPPSIRLLPDEPEEETYSPPSGPEATPVPDPTRTFATLLSAELYGITELAASPEPKRALALIDRYLGILVDTADRHDAFVDQVSPEHVQAFWVAPVEGPTGPLRAIECALEISAALVALNAELSAEGLFPVQVAMAIHCGEAVAGELGAGTHRDFKVVGDPVHLAARLSASARPGEILMTEATYALINGAARTCLMPYIEVPGWSGHGHIYQVQGLHRN